MRVISLCVDGIEQAAERGLYKWVAEQDADDLASLSCHVPLWILHLDAAQL